MDGPALIGSGSTIGFAHGLTQFPVPTLCFLQGFFSCLAFLNFPTNFQYYVFSQTVIGWQQALIVLNDWRILLQRFQQQLLIEVHLRQPLSSHQTDILLHITLTDGLRTAHIPPCLQFQYPALNRVLFCRHSRLPLHPPKEHFTEKTIFLINEIHRSCKFQCPLAEDEPTHLSGAIRESDYFFGVILGMEGDPGPATIVPHCRIKPKFHLSLETAVQGEIRGADEGRRYRRMVTDLLPIEERPCHFALVCLSEDGIEGLVTANVARRTTQAEFYHSFKPLYCWQLPCSFQDERGVAKRPQQEGQIGISAEDSHWQRYAGHLATRQQSFEDVFYDTALSLQLVLVADHQLPIFALRILSFEEVVPLA